jgi:HPt (histidine-containing phosphotransfer) domain-containing protein
MNLLVQKNLTRKCIYMSISRKESAHSFPLIHPTQYASILKAIGNDGAELAARFLVDCDNTLQKLGDLTDIKSASEIVEAAHSLKGSSSMLGFARIAHLAATLETEATNAADLMLPLDLADFREALQLTREALRLQS